ncbi:uncharacterized protein L3040_005668 [Drepanopeziza brunnea f. sp. 'multigermtubi']|uniref:Glutathione S-transferase n=1 Tax=Marssonina brunnea f. sp. multigermtubi (strain MB_m1) TaxID=1072389 RepID=K1WLJ0_MARBU|nr:glutathione S-transferase [Drepanopeziza brunnea f. sp. 'multigermtubi' MB_m1]EKD13711.1 glutathione S-transferase [Drepanopeziza brunnea f. sp. 'multigermtubi' MB_m1]KAJ5041114.1 hypothetical protein L3040_005668 [Drepanopeziza brunnea f. sp. 'multigermtubi']
MPPSEDILLYHYHASPYAKRIVWYLNLRRIPYTQCLQPPVMPRPDTAAIGTLYRRIPILSIGLDIYNDTRLILSKLQNLYPPSPSHPPLPTPFPSAPASGGVEKLLSNWVIGGLFAKAAALIPSHLPIMKDERFKKDREEFSGTSWDATSREKERKEALVDIKRAFELLETTFLGDGRDWVLATKGPSLGDIEAVWPFHWLTTLPGALPTSYISPAQFPRTFAWISRFDAHARSAATTAGKPKTVTGDQAVQIMQQSSLVERELGVEDGDPSGLRHGERVEVWPVDSGRSGRDRGRLVGLNGNEIVVVTEGGKVEGVRVHCPREGFRVRRAPEGKL